MPTPIQQITAMYKNDPILMDELRTAMALVTPNDNITQARVTAYITSLCNNASDETINLFLIRTQLFLLIDAKQIGKRFELNAQIVSRIKRMLESAGAVIAPN